jgi:hypothetical protein
VNKNDEEMLSAQYVKFLHINQSGNTFACAYGNGTRFTGYLNSNEFIKPLETQSYDRIDDLVIHPFEPMMGLTSFRAGMSYIIMNTAEYDGGSMLDRSDSRMMDRKSISAGIHSRIHS